MAHRTATELNTSLIAKALRIEPLDYLKSYASVDPKFDLAFASELYELVRREDCCIPHRMLVKWGVLGCDRFASGRTREMLGQYGLVESRDYVVVSGEVERTFAQIPEGSPSDAEVKKPAPKRGRGRPAINYLLHPDALQLCLMRAKNTRKYAEHFMSLNRGLVAYDEYCKLFREHYIETLTVRHTAETKQKDDKIDSLEALIREMRSEMASGHRELKADIQVVIGQNEGLRADIAVVAGAAFESVEEIREISDRLDEVSDLVAPRPAARGSVEHLIIVRTPNPGRAYPYQVIRRQARSVSSTLKRVRREDPAAQIVLNLPGVPNARTLWLRIRERHVAQLAFSPASLSRFSLRGLTEAAFAASARALATEPQRELGAATAAARTRAQRVVETVAQRVVETLTDEDYALFGL
jgi:hypothetical protein